MNNINIVPMTADHLDALEQLERTCFSRPWSRKMLAEELDNECAAFLVAEDAAAIALYTRFGFREAGRRRNYYDLPREDALILTRTFGEESK